MKKIILIGSTGSIGRQVISVVNRYPDRFKITALAAGHESELLTRQLKQLNPEHGAFTAGEISSAALEDADTVFNAASGFAGLKYSLAAVRAGKELALANKETLVCAAEGIMQLAQKTGARIIPIDSEHSAIWQCLNFSEAKQVRRLIITASGGAFRNYSAEQLKYVTCEQALNHPTWNMGKKITVDSATLMNKGYEVIEAHALFNVPYENIEAVIQPQSVIHSLVEFSDGSTLAQLSRPTMEVPIQLALSYPERLNPAVQPMDYTKPFSLEFSPLDRGKYPCFNLALECGKAGGAMPCVLNAADEVAVEAFLKGRIAFTDIYRVADGVVQSTQNENVQAFSRLYEIDKEARAAAIKIIDRF